MIQPAVKYEIEVQEAFKDTWEDTKYLYYFCDEQFIPEIIKNAVGIRQLVSVTDEGVILGYITYNISMKTCAAYDFALINFGEPSLTFSYDVLQAIHDIFTKYNLSKLCFGCVTANDAYKTYLKICEQANGKQCGYYKRHTWCYDNTIHDYAAFEILREDYLESDMYKKMEKRLKRQSNGKKKEKSEQRPQVLHS